MAKQQQDQLSDEELEQIKRYGQALGGVPPFDEEVHRWAEIHEAHYAKMRAGPERAAAVSEPV